MMCGLPQKGSGPQRKVRWTPIQMDSARCCTDLTVYSLAATTTQMEGANGGPSDDM